MRDCHQLSTPRTWCNSWAEQAHIAWYSAGWNSNWETCDKQWAGKVEANTAQLAPLSASYRVKYLLPVIRLKITPHDNWTFPFPNPPPLQESSAAQQLSLTAHKTPTAPIHPHGPPTAWLLPQGWALSEMECKSSCMLIFLETWSVAYIWLSKEVCDQHPQS